MQDFDRKSARRLEVKGPGTVQPSGLGHLVSVLAEPIVDLVDALFAPLNETDMKAGGIARLGAILRQE